MNIVKSTIAHLSSDKLTNRIVRELHGREIYISNEFTFVENVFYGNVFEGILGEVGENDTFDPFDEESLAILEKLSELIDTNYVMVTFVE